MVDVHIKNLRKKLPSVYAKRLKTIWGKGYRLAYRFERFPHRQPINLPEGVIAPRLEDVLRDLTKSLILVNGFLLALAAVLSYWLAGTPPSPRFKLYMIVNAAF